MEGNLGLRVLPDGYLVSSSMHQNHNIVFTEQHLPPSSYFMENLEPNVHISDDSNSQHVIDLVPDINGHFSVQRFHTTASGKRVVVRVVSFFGPFTLIVTLIR